MRVITLKNYGYLMLLIISLLPVFPTYSQNDEIEINEPTLTHIYVCVSHENGYNLFEFFATEPLGLIFSTEVTVVVFSNEIPLSADIIHILPDTYSGTYRWAGTVLLDANTTANIPYQDTCETAYPEYLNNLNRTIQLPLSPDQAINIHRVGANITYENSANTLMNGAIGILFREQPSLPHFQILRFAGGEDDTISISLPDFDEEVELYAVSRSRVSYIRIDSDGFESVSKFMDGRNRFLNRLNGNGGSLIETIMSPGNFRFYIEYGEEIIYEPGGLLNITRLSSYTPRHLTHGMILQPISCGVSIPFNVPFYHIHEYSQYLYLQFPIDISKVVGNSTCTNSYKIIVPNENNNNIMSIRDDGILLVNSDNEQEAYSIAAWLVEPREQVLEE